ncbi:PD-(D/E)XK motif protein [Corynebacterium variabile]|uniref:PD-(D/E)XK motif protein n=1 Tax=Corynebacterium variabile TaxID=1727 RepID=UPI003FD22BB2
MDYEINRDSIRSALAEASSLSGELEEGSLAVSPISGFADYMVAVTQSGGLAIAIATTASPYSTPDVRLATLSAHYGVSCRLRSSHSARTARVSLIYCLSSDSEVRTIFLDFAINLFYGLPDKPSDNDVAAGVDQWLRLFRKLDSIPRSGVVGLIGELVVIEAGDSLDRWVRAWHLNSNDAIDFTFERPQLEVEVKSTQGARRVHKVSANQAYDRIMDSFFASVVVDLRTNGTSVGDFARSIADSLSDEESRLLLWTTIAGVCGKRLQEYLSVCFSKESTMSSLSFYRSDQIPKPSLDLPMPQGVLDLHFTSDFSGCLPVDRGRLCTSPD